jgi:large subunit ribosomal protein L7/L12
MAKLTNEELIEAFKELTIIELSEFVKLFEETFEGKTGDDAIGDGLGEEAGTGTGMELGTEGPDGGIAM